MALAETLGYEMRPPRGARAAVVAALELAPLAALVRVIADPVDRAVLRITDGSTTATAALTGLPVLWVSTIGARSGRIHRVPLLAIPHAGSLHVLGTGFGKETTPAWVHNLLANPVVTVEHRDRSASARAVTVSQDAQEPIWETAARMYPNYAGYRERASGREIVVFRLEQVG